MYEPQSTLHLFISKTRNQTNKPTHKHLTNTQGGTQTNRYLLFLHWQVTSAVKNAARTNNTIYAFIVAISVGLHIDKVMRVIRPTYYILNLTEVSAGFKTGLCYLMVTVSSLSGGSGLRCYLII